MRIHTVAAAALLVGTAGAGWELSRRRDQERLDRDPERGVLDEPDGDQRRTLVSEDGVELDVTIAGPATAPTVVCLHGWGMSSRFWHYQLRDLPPDIRVVAYDQRGHGRSTPAADDRYRLQDLAHDLDVVLDACVPGGTRPVLVGHSLGGMTILEWARRRPGSIGDEVAGTVLVNTAADEVTSRVFPGLAIGQRLLDAFGRRLVTSQLPTPRRTTPISSRIVGAVALGEDPAPAHVALTEQLFFDCPDDIRAAFGVALAELDLEDAVGHLDVPTLVLTGTRDRLIPLHHSRRLADLLPSGDLTEFAGAGHQVPLERHREVTDLIRRFTADVGA